MHQALAGKMQARTQIVILFSLQLNRFNFLLSWGHIFQSLGTELWPWLGSSIRITQWGTCETLRTLIFDSPRVWLKLLLSSHKAYMLGCPSETPCEKTHAKFATQIRVYRTIGVNPSLPSSSSVNCYKPSKVNRVMEPLSIQSFYLTIVDWSSLM